MGSKLFDRAINGSSIFASKGNVINVDGDKDPDMAILSRYRLIYPASTRLNPNLSESRVQLDVPLTSCLLEDQYRDFLSLQTLLGPPLHGSHLAVSL